MANKLSRWMWTSNAHRLPKQGFLFNPPLSAINARKAIRTLWVDLGSAARMPSGFRLHAPITATFEGNTCDNRDVAVRLSNGQTETITIQPIRLA